MANTCSKSVVKTIEKYQTVINDNSNKNISFWFFNFEQINVIAFNLMGKYLFKVNISFIRKTSVDIVLMFKILTLNSYLSIQLEQ